MSILLTDADGHYFAAWSANSPERLRFIVDKEREGVSMDDIVVLVAQELKAPRDDGPGKCIAR